MDYEFTSNNDVNDAFTFNKEETDYEKLLARLKDISSTIALLEKKYSDKI